MESMNKGLTVPKWVLIVRPKISQMPQKFIGPICLPKPKSLRYPWKKPSLGVRSPWLTICIMCWNPLWNRIFVLWVCMHEIINENFMLPYRKVVSFNTSRVHSEVEWYFWFENCLIPWMGLSYVFLNTFNESMSQKSWKIVWRPKKANWNICWFGIFFWLKLWKVSWIVWISYHNVYVFIKLIS